MIFKHADDVPSQAVTMEGVEGTEIQWLVTEEDGAPTCALRRFTIRPGGVIPLHGHEWEHEIYILAGEARAFTGDSSVDVRAGDVLFIPPGELHGYESTGDGDLSFLCVVPKGAR